jgi:hypothetical protein
LEKVIRIDSFTNFNYTDEEFEQLKEWDDKGRVFVNSNSFVVIRGSYPVVMCVNPYLDRFVKPKGDLSIIRAIRVKYVYNPKPEVRKAFIDSVRWGLERGIPILITYMRFRKEETLLKYAQSHTNYVFQKNYFRQQYRQTYNHQGIHYCDINEMGCPYCRNCAFLTFGITDLDIDIYSVNLSSSGECNFRCPDCYVNTFKSWCGGIKFDKLLQNSKQQGHKRYAMGYGKQGTLFAYASKEYIEQNKHLIDDEKTLFDDVIVTTTIRR